MYWSIDYFQTNFMKNDKTINFIDSFYISYKSDVKTFLIWFINNYFKVIVNTKFQKIMS